MEEQTIIISEKEYEALIRLKKAGVRSAMVAFIGSEADGYYKDLSLHPVPKKYQRLENDIRTVEEYIYELLDREDRISFHGNGCRGYIRLNLLDDFSLSLLIEAPSWIVEVNEKKEILPNSEIQGLLAKIDEQVEQF